MFDDQKRVVDEKIDLDSMRGRLRSFMAGTTFPAPDEDERMRLQRQYDTMNLYSNVLGERIAAFSP